MSNIETSKKRVSFAAIDPYIETNIILPTESIRTGRDYVDWGTRNGYPDYLLDLYSNVPTLQSIINGNIDFIAGDDVEVVRPLFDDAMNAKGDTAWDIVRALAKDFEIYGGYALQVIRNAFGDIREVYHLDMRFVRSNKENDVFYYCENWGKRGSHDVVVYPAFMPNLDWGHLDEAARNSHLSSVLFVKNVDTRVYPVPVYAAAVKACETERSIDDYHLNAINNGFTGSLMVNFNNGIPNDKTMKEIEDDFTEKFTGHQNAGRVMFSWNRSKENECTLAEPKVEDFGDRYQTLEKHSRQQIFTAFRAIPLLFGMTSDISTGFSTDEFEQSFKLYNRTQIRPIQKRLAKTFEKLYGVQGALTIKPFSIEGESEKEVQ